MSNSFADDLNASVAALELNQPMQLAKDYAKFTGIVFTMDQLRVPDMLIAPGDPAFVKTLKSAAIYLGVARGSDLLKIWFGI